MYYLTVVDRQAAIKDGYDNWLIGALILEIVLLVYSYFELFVDIYFLHRVKQSHYNYTILLRILAWQYVFSMSARITQNMYHIMEPNNEILKDSSLFTACVYVRHSMLYMAFSTSVFFCIERTIATKLVADYEHNIRPHIGWILAVLWAVYSFGSSYFTIVGTIPAYVQFLIFIPLNLAALIGTFIIEFVNMRWYRRIRVRNVHYSLSERMQVAENVRSAQPFKIINASITVFSLLCVSFVVIEARVEDDLLLTNIMYIGFNYACLIYGVLLPPIVFIFSPNYVKEAKRWLSIIRRDSESRSTSIEVVGLMGKSLIYRNSAQTDEYFNQLNSSWNK